LWNWIKGFFNREYELISNLDWHSEDGECIRATILAYHQLLSEEDARIQKLMDNKNKNLK
jgi:hypothetical protein